MDFLGVGPLELIFVFLIALIVLGPRAIVKAGRTMGRVLRRIVTSPTWQAIRQTSRDFRHIPNKLMREAGMEESMKDLTGIKQDVDELKKTRVSLNKDLEKETKTIQKDLSAWTTPPTISSPPPPASNSKGKVEKPVTSESTDKPTQKEDNV